MDSNNLRKLSDKFNEENMKSLLSQAKERKLKRHQ